MGQTWVMPPPTRRTGRPTAEQSAQLDADVHECALQLFLERGFDGTSMDDVARAAGTTKQSLYARFPSKEELFRSVLLGTVSRPDWPRPAPPVPDLDDLEGALRSIADAALQRALDPKMVQLSRIATAQAARFPDLVRQTLSTSSWPRHDVMVALIERHVRRGTVVVDDPQVVAELFLGMVAGMPARLAGFGILRDPATQAYHTDVAVRLFLRALQPG